MIAKSKFSIYFSQKLALIKRNSTHLIAAKSRTETEIIFLFFSAFSLLTGITENVRTNNGKKSNVQITETEMLF